MFETVFPQLSSLVIEQVIDLGVTVGVVARTPAAVSACPDCGQLSDRVHAYHQRRLADLPVGGRAVVVHLRVRRLVCAARSCSRRTFREQVPAVTQRWARRTRQLTALVADLAVVTAGRAGAAVLARVGARVSRSTVLRVLMAQPIPDRAVPAVLSVDDFALRRGRRYATLLIDAVTHRRVDVLPDRKADTLAGWLRDHPGVQVVCRDGSAAYAEAIRTGAPQAVQVSDRWHLWANLAKAVEKTVIAHSGCWRDGPVRPDRAGDERTRDRHRAVHTLLDQGHGLLECARRLGWALNTVKRYARATSAEELKRPPRYRETLVDPFREHLRRRRAEEPGVAVTKLLAEIRELGYTGSANLLVRYLNQGRADALRTPPSPRRLVSWLMSRPADLPAAHQQQLADLLASCAHLCVLAERVQQFADLLTGRRGEDLDAWMTCADADDLPALHGFVHGLRRDLPAVVAGLTLPYSNGPIEGANTKVKYLKRQMYGRAGFDLLRHRVLLA
ncbi:MULTISPECIES: ISL3 family transposase [Catenuloplanes]|uniref:Transposase n=1 Tax=Catenuloplanes niger TaxID=587534 RepID=A0AAE3ZHJ8_9ACTN|nr:ISL3 family transposase [Catenuloplanes niger]MDR7320043.1 transposase [Catenuloplanes niger]